ncbi:MAG TPA: septal ring lytic transglycosylase RlpA family protein, partial [Ferruginibacter sp.]|nr:septal ring lytic transglycosylase RlpA family protein [Ferruginibacter sp.]
MIKVLFIKRMLIFLFAFISAVNPSILNAQSNESKAVKKYTKKESRIFYGLASYYADKFHGRRTANGEIFSQTKMTAACNVLPLGTWIQVTNLKNGKIVV